MGRKKTFNRDTFSELFYVKKCSYEEISKILNVPVPTLSDYRWRNKLPVRGWKQHPQLGKKKTIEEKRKMSERMIGVLALSKNPNWKGGRYEDINGYIQLRVENHPFAYRGYIREHRYIMEQYIGRFLDRKEIVHHINHIRNDNRIENLKLFSSNSEHAKGHCPKGSLIGCNFKKSHCNTNK